MQSKKKIASWASQRANFLNIWANIRANFLHIEANIWVNFLNTQKANLFKLIREGQNNPEEKKRDQRYEQKVQLQISICKVIKNENNNDANFPLTDW